MNCSENMNEIKYYLQFLFLTGERNIMSIILEKVLGITIIKHLKYKHRQGKIQIYFQDTRFKMGEMGRVCKGNQEIDWKRHGIKVTSNLLWTI